MPVESNPPPGVHPTAVIDRRAEVARDLVAGPYAIVEAGAIIGPGCVLHAHAMVRGAAILGAGNVVHPFAVLGAEGQAKRHAGPPGRLEVGEGNVFREHATLHGGTDGRSTRVGSRNLFMVGAHAAHDVSIGSDCVFANGTQLAGHAVIGDWVTFGGLSGVAQHVRVGESAFVAAAAACERDVPPFVVVQGDRAKVRGLNVVGLRRRGVPEASVAALRSAVRRLWMSRVSRTEALASLTESADPYVRALLDALTRDPAPGA
jgi:UDP-N-acetylglucosamine acyltransferase